MTVAMHYPSELACQAAGLAPKGTPHAGAPTCCAMCGRPIITGTPSLPLELSRTFTNHAWLQPSSHLCGWCEVVSEQNVLRAFQRAVVTPKGCFSIGTDAARSWLWLTPPEPPYVVVINSSTTGAFHYLWMTPVTLDSRLLKVNFDGAVASVHPTAIRQAIHFAGVLQQRALDDGHKKIPRSPFIRLARDAYKELPAGHGQVAPLFISLAKRHADCREAVEYLLQLSSGDLVALASILKAKPVEPEMPALVSGKALFSKNDPAE